MEIYLICKPDKGITKNNPFVLTYDRIVSGFAGFKNTEIAEYFISALSLNDYEPVRINTLPADKLKECDRIVIFETQANIHSIFEGKVKSLFKKAKMLTAVMPDIN